MTKKLVLLPGTGYCVKPGHWRVGSFDVLLLTAYRSERYWIVNLNGQYQTTELTLRSAQQWCNDQIAKGRVPV